MLKNVYIKNSLGSSFKTFWHHQNTSKKTHWGYVGIAGDLELMFRFMCCFITGDVDTCSALYNPLRLYKLLTSERYKYECETLYFLFSKLNQSRIPASTFKWWKVWNLLLGNRKEYPTRSWWYSGWMKLSLKCKYDLTWLS